MSLLAHRFAEAVQILVGDGAVKARLSRAYAEYLEDLADSAFPAGLQGDFGILQTALNRIDPVGSETRVRASVQKMSSSEAELHAGTIVKLYVALVSQLERAEPLKIVQTPTKAPSYLTNRN